MFGQNRKKTWDDGTIVIFLDNDQIQYRTGSVIRGRIVVNQQKEFNCTELVVGIHGSEQTYFRLYESTMLLYIVGKGHLSTKASWLTAIQTTSHLWVSMNSNSSLGRLNGFQTAQFTQLLTQAQFLTSGTAYLLR